MRLGLSSAAFYGRMETEEQALLLSELPLECCEVFLQCRYEYRAEFGALVRRNLGALPCTSVHPKGTQFEADLFARSDRQVQEAREVLRRVCAAGRALGAQYYIFHGPFGVHAPLQPAQINNVVENLSALQAIAGEYGLEILWENVHWCALKTPEDVRQARQLLPGMRFTLDVKQACMAGVEPVEMLRAMEGRLAHVHVLDRREDGQLCLPGQGCVDWQGLARELRRQDYRGAVILEPYERHSRDAGALLESLAFLRETLLQS